MSHSSTPTPTPTPRSRPRPNAPSAEAGGPGQALTLLIEEIDRDRFQFRLDATDRDRGPSLETYGPVQLRGDAREVAQETCQALSKLAGAIDGGVEGAASIARHQIESRGLELARRVVPEGLRRRLWQLRDPARSLQIVSDEPWLPWHLCRLEARDGAADDDATDGANDGAFLCEAFTLTHFLPGLRQPTRFALRRIAVLALGRGLPAADAELRQLQEIATAARRVELVPPRLPAVLEALGSGRYDAWHLIGHARFDRQHPDRSAITLDDGRPLTPGDLAACHGFGARRPLVVWNACATARAGHALVGLGGWPRAALDAGAGAFLGTSWQVADDLAAELSAVFYRSLLDGASLAEATRAGREAIRMDGDPTWLAYCLFANAEARLGEVPEPVAAPRGEQVSSGPPTPPRRGHPIGLRRPGRVRSWIVRPAALLGGAAVAALGRAAIDVVQGDFSIGGAGPVVFGGLAVALGLSALAAWRGHGWRSVDDGLLDLGLLVAAFVATWFLVG